MLWVSVKGFDLFKPFIPLDCVVFVVSNRWCWLSLLSLHVNVRDDVFFSFYPVVLSFFFALWPWMGLFRKRGTLSWRLLHLLIAAPEVVKIMAEAAQSKGRRWWRCVPPASGVMVSRERKTAASLPLSLALETLDRVCSTTLCPWLTGDPSDTTPRTLEEITRHHDKTQMQLVAGWQSATL